MHKFIHWLSELMSPKACNMLQLQDLANRSATPDRIGYFLLSLSQETQECALCLQNMALLYRFYIVLYLRKFLPTVVNNSSTQTLKLLNVKTPSCLQIQIFRWQHMDETEIPQLWACHDPFRMTTIKSETHQLALSASAHKWKQILQRANWRI